MLLLLLDCLIELNVRTVGRIDECFNTVVVNIRRDNIVRFDWWGVGAYARLSAVVIIWL